MRPFFLCLSLFAATLWISLAGSPGQALAQDPQLNLPVEELVIRSGDKEHQFKAEVAATDRQRSMGLMFRKEMPAERGMLFLFEGEGDRYFWMKNTPLPLDIIFIDAKGAIVSIADNTTLTPLGQRPLDLGVDVVVSSDTKSMGGHSDALMGHVATRDAARLEAMGEWRSFSGSIPGPQEAWLAHRGLETLDVRFDRMCSTAEVLAERLAAHPLVREIRFPGLESDPSHALAKQQMSRFGFLISITLDSAGQADAFINNCPLIRSATSFGGVHTSAERRARWGDAVAPGFVRISVGTEPAEELWSAMAASLDALGR